MSETMKPHEASDEITPAAPTQVSSDRNKKKLSDSAEELEAEADKMNAERALLEARWSFADRLIMRGLIPICLLIGGPASAYYFHQRAEKSDGAVTQLGDIAKKNEAIIARLEQILVVNVARQEAQVFGKSEFRRRIASSNQGATWRDMRADVERILIERVSNEVGADGEVVKRAVIGAVDEIAPEFESLANAKGIMLVEPAPSVPRFGDQRPQQKQ